MHVRPDFHHKRSPTLKRFDEFIAGVLGAGQVVYADSVGNLKTEAGFEYEDIANKLFVANLSTNSIEFGGLLDTTLARFSVGDLSIEGNRIYRVNGLDVSIADGGSNASTAADARTNFGLIAGGAGDIWAEKAGDIFTGDVAISKASPILHLDGTGITSSELRLTRGGITKWVFTNEGGAADDLLITDNAIILARMARTTGNLTLTGDVMINKILPVFGLDSGAGQIARLQFREAGLVLWQWISNNDDLVLFRGAGEIINATFAQATGNLTLAGNVTISKATADLIIDGTGATNSNIILKRDGIIKWFLYNDVTTSDTFRLYDGTANVFAVAVGGNTTLVGNLTVDGNSQLGDSTTDTANSKGAHTTGMGTSTSTMTLHGKASFAAQASGTSLSYILPANSLNAANKGLRATAWGSAGATEAITVSFGGTTIFSWIPGTSVFNIDIFIFSTGVDAQRYMVRAYADVSTDVVDVEHGTLAKDDGINQTLTVSAGSGGVMHALLVEFFN